MSGQHTQGRLVVKANGDANSYALLDQNGIWWMSVLMNGQQLTETQKANARRLAACWNACQHASTDELEVHGQHWTTAFVMNAALAQERDQARDDLLAVRDECRAIEANYEAARALLREIDRMDDACGIATGPGEAFTTYEFKTLMGKVSAFLKGGA